MLVHLILDRNYGERLFDLDTNATVWACDSEENRTAGVKLWKLFPNRQLTLFYIGDTDTPREMCYEQILTILEHHPSCTQIKIISPTIAGCQLELEEVGFDRFESTTDGLLAIKVHGGF